MQIEIEKMEAARKAKEDSINAKIIEMDRDTVNSEFDDAVQPILPAKPAKPYKDSLPKDTTTAAILNDEKQFEVQKV